MRTALLAVVVVVCGSVSVWGGVYRVVEWDGGGVTVEFTIPVVEVGDGEGGEGGGLRRVTVEGFFTMDREGEPLLPVRRFLIEVPTVEGVTMRVVEVERYYIEGVAPRVYVSGGTIEDERRVLEGLPVVGEEGFVRLKGVGTFRGRHLAFVDVSPVLFDREGWRLSCVRRCVVRVDFPWVKEGGRVGGEGVLYGEVVVNGDQASGWRHGEGRVSGGVGEPFEFGLSDMWVKIPVVEKGVYVITYDNLYNALVPMGVSLSSVDPATMRLFSGGPYAQPDSIDEGGSFREGYHLTEHAIMYRGGGTGEFSPGDTVFFYGLGSRGWARDYDPEVGVREYERHPYSAENVYWLTWGGSFSGVPRRMGERVVVPGGMADTVITSYEERIHREEDNYYDAIYTDDRWYWRLLPEKAVSTFTDEFVCDDLVSANGVLKTLGYGPWNSESAGQKTAQYLVNNALAGALTWTVSSIYNPAAMKRLTVPVSNLVSGRNGFKVVKALADEAYVFWYEVFYERQLKARLGWFDFNVPERGLRAGYTLSGFPYGERLLFDVTRDESPVVCTGWQAGSGSIVFEDSLGGYGRHYLAVSRSALRRAELEARRVVSLRDEVECPDMVIIYHERFREAAQMLKAHRERSLPGVADPVVKAVDVEDVYDNFSGGLKDPIAIRNYLKYLYDRGSCWVGGDPRLKYVFLIGNGTYDPRDVLGQGNDFVPLYINIFYRSNEGVEDDDFLVKLDGGMDPVPDLAIGRLSVVSEREAVAWAERIVDYEEQPEFGAWRDKVILVADDEYSKNPFLDFSFLGYSEDAAARNGTFPNFIDFRKIYSHIYPYKGSLKPSAKHDLLNEWSEGALIVSYIGHGSPLQMADEQVMVNSDIYSLTNGNRRPLMLSFSCSVGDLESPYHRSMAQNAVTYDRGGAIATIAAAAPTYGEPNGFLMLEIFRRLFTSKDSTGTVPVGWALRLGKIFTGWPDEMNSSMYILLGDPALKLAVPAYTVRHETASIDTMLTGHRYRVEGSVRVGGAVDASFNGTADVVVQEAENGVHKFIDGNDVNYTLLGRELYRGTYDVEGGRFGADFMVPMRCRAGYGARIRSYVASGSVDGVGACDTLRIVAADTLPGNEGPPRINLFFAGEATKVKEGARLMAEISDPDGIAILGADPQSSIFLEFDGSGYPVYVTDYFVYDHGSSTKGRVEYRLQPGMSPGGHTVSIKAFDNLGAFASDTLRFEIIEEGLYTVSDVFSVPNPFTEVTNVVFQVTCRAEATLSIYSVSGTKVWEGRAAVGEGFNSMVWDGRDGVGDRVANGTYLYVLEVDFPDSYHREQTVKGKVVLLR